MKAPLAGTVSTMINMNEFVGDESGSVVVAWTFDIPKTHVEPENWPKLSPGQGERALRRERLLCAQFA